MSCSSSIVHAIRNLVCKYLLCSSVFKCLGKQLSPLKLLGLVIWLLYGNHVCIHVWRGGVMYVPTYLIFASFSELFTGKQVQLGIDVLAEANYCYDLRWTLLKVLKWSKTNLMQHKRHYMWADYSSWIISCWKCYTKLNARGGVCMWLCINEEQPCFFPWFFMCLCWFRIWMWWSVFCF